MLERLTVDRLTPLVGSTFRLAVTEIALVLRAVRPLSEATAVPGSRVPFALDFGGPQPPLPQGTYDFQHEELGALAIFIVPVGADATHSYYEAIFT